MEFPAIYLSRVPRNLNAIMSYAKHKHKGATLTPTQPYGHLKNKQRIWLNQSKSMREKRKEEKEYPREKKVNTTQENQLNMQKNSKIEFYVLLMLCLTHSFIYLVR